MVNRPVGLFPFFSPGRRRLQLCGSVSENEAGRQTLPHSHHDDTPCLVAQRHNTLWTKKPTTYRMKEYRIPNLRIK